VLPGCWFVVGETAAAARRAPDHQRDLNASPHLARKAMEQVWGRDLTDVDVDGPFPDVEPDLARAATELGKQTVGEKDPARAVAQGRALAAEHGWSVRQVVREKSTRFAIVGDAEQVADEIERWLDAGACDGFIATPALLPGGLDELTALVVPELQRRGRFRTAYESPSLRARLEGSARARSR
jgi:alkanesulfonate monooxygenase SsuD/methylene tetrahydromethanopterin reductase-like flavin-dependent oxidoreductase (luciferase family)